MSLVLALHYHEIILEYGNSLHFWDFSTGRLQQSVKLGDDGLIPLEIRFMHNPNQPIGFVGCALSSTIKKFEQNQVSDDTKFDSNSV